jgi:hypothetical protein
LITVRAGDRLLVIVTVFTRPAIFLLRNGFDLQRLDNDLALPGTSLLRAC